MASISPHNGKYRVRWRVHGQSRSRVFDNAEAARLFKIEVESDLVTGKAIDPVVARTTFAQWGTDWSRNRQGLRTSTTTRNNILMTRHLIPRFGTAQLSKITQPQVQEFVTDLATKNGWTGKPLAPATIREIYQELEKCLNAAVSAKLLRDNPCVAITLPKVEQQDMLFLTQDQVHDLAESILDRYRALIYVLAYTGLRIGEAAALTPDSIDLENGLVKVTQTASEVSGQIITNQPKTKAGRRTVPMPKFVTKELAEHMRKYPAPFVFTGRQGGQIRANAFRQRAFKNGKAKAGLPPEVRIHDLRHTAVSFWIANGVDLLRVKKWIGHASASFTIDRYGHLYEDDNAAILGGLNKSIKKSKKGRLARS